MSLNHAVLRMRTRSDLHFKYLGAFKNFCEAERWVEHPTKSPHEALRMKRNNEWLIVHRKDSATQHLTVWGNSAELTHRFLRVRKDAEREVVKYAEKGEPKPSL